MFSRLLRWRLAPLLVPIAVVAASVGAVAVGFLGSLQAERTHDGLTRFDDGETIAVEVAEPGRHLVWVRHDDYAGASPDLLTLTVARDGTRIATRTLPGDVTYQETDTAITALWAFDADRPGRYDVTGSDINRSTTFLTGPDDPQAELERATRLAKRGLLGIVIGLVGVTVTGALIGRRSRTRPHHDPPSAIAGRSATLGS